MKTSPAKLLKKIENNIKKIKNLKILVIGDIILDRWLKGTVERISPEAPVPVLRVEKEWNDLGGAANVAKILSFYSKNITLMGYIGKDQFAYRVKRLLKKYNIQDYSIYYDKTIVKTRLIAQNNQQIARVDRESPHISVPSKIFKEKIITLKNGFDAVFLIDYNKGIFTQENLELIKNTFETKYYISLKPSNFDSFSLFLKENFVKLLSLNKYEFNEIIKKIGINNNDFTKDAISFFKNNNNLSTLLITLGRDGLCVINEKEFIKIDGIEVEVFDVTGAGDNVISIFGLFDIIGFNNLESGVLANIAGSICVSKPGTIAVKFNDIYNFLSKYQKMNSYLSLSILNMEEIKT